MVLLDLPAHRPHLIGTRFADLGDHQPLGFVSPNWFASVMGTGIVANAAATLPWRPTGLLVAARAVWVLDVVLLAVVVVATVLHHRHHPDVARSHLGNATLGHFYGAPAMALMTVGAGALLVGTPVVGTPVAVGLDVVLWSAGTALGLATAVVLPYRTFTRTDVGPDAAGGAWLMPIVPPMVSAATGPLLIPHLPAGQLRLSMQVGCAAMFGLALVASLVVVGLIWARLAHRDVGPAAAVPTLWIVLGPLGQSVTALHTMGATAPTVLPAPYGDATTVAGVVLGLPIWGFAMLWAALATAITVRTARSEGGLPFSLTWWSFTFPVGTVVTGTSALAAATGASLLAGAAVLFYAVLVGAWLLVATRTVRGVWRGSLLRPPTSAPA